MTESLSMVVLETSLKIRFSLSGVSVCLFVCLSVVCLCCCGDDDDDRGPLDEMEGLTTYRKR